MNVTFQDHPVTVLICGDKTNKQTNKQTSKQLYEEPGFSFENEHKNAKITTYR